MEIDKIALELNLDDILKHCATNKKLKKLICDNQDFWKEKIYKDFPNASTLLLYGSSYKEIYINLSKKIEIFLNIKIIQRFYQDDEEILKEINLEKLLNFKNIESDIDKKITDILTKLFQKIEIKGKYNVLIDGTVSCNRVENLKDCVRVNQDTKEILVYLYTKENIDENDEKIYQQYLD
jgi:hypothetical protein